MLTVVTFLWDGWNPIYGPHHVNALARMVAEHLHVPHQFVCITNQNEKLDCFEYPLWDIPKVISRKRQNSYVRLRLFDPAIQRELGATSILSIDLDTVILKPINQLIPGPEHGFFGVRGVCAPLNGSMFFIRAGHHANVWRDFDPMKAPDQIRDFRLPNGDPVGGSDQAWMSMKIPNPGTWSSADGVYHYSTLCKTPPATVRETEMIRYGNVFIRVPVTPKPVNVIPEDARIVFFAGGVKPWDTACRETAPRLFDEYRRYL